MKCIHRLMGKIKIQTLILCASWMTIILILFAKEIHLNCEFISQHNTPLYFTFIRFYWLLNLCWSFVFRMDTKHNILWLHLICEMISFLPPSVVCINHANINCVHVCSLQLCVCVRVKMILFVHTLERRCSQVREGQLTTRTSRSYSSYSTGLIYCE